MKKLFVQFIPTLFSLVLIFASCSKDDASPSGDDSNTSTTNVSAGINSYVSQNYAGYSIYEVAKEDWCKDQYLIKVGIQKGSQELHLVFDLNEKFVFKAIRIAEGQLPAAVSSSQSKLFAGYEIKDDNDVEELQYTDGSKRYYLRLRKSSGGGGSDVRVMFLANGTVFCQRN
jgi:hypothetical protein